MADKTRTVSIIIQARNAADAALSKVGLSLNAIGLAAKAASIAAVAAGATLAAAFAKAVSAAAKQEEADVRLAAALRTVGDNTADARAHLDALATELQDLTTIDDQVVKGVQGILTSMGRLTGELRDRATKAVLDFAAATGQDATSAATLVAKAADGYTAALTRYGFRVDDSLSKSEKFQSVLEQMERKFGGLAEASGRTFSGSLRRISNDIGDLLEKIGDVVVKSGAWQDAMAGLHKFIKNIQEGSSAFIPVIRSVSDAFLSRVAGMARAAAEIAFLLGKLPGEELKKIRADIESFQAGIRAAADQERLLRTESFDTAEGLMAVRRALRGRGEEKGDVAAGLGQGLKELKTNADEVTEAFRMLGIEGFGELQKKADAAKVVLEQGLLAVLQGDISQKQFEILLEQVDEITEKLRESGAEAIEIFPRAFAAVPPMLDTISAGVERARDVSLEFSDALIDAAFGARISWAQFFRSLIADLIKAIAKAKILAFWATLGKFVSFGGAAATDAAAGGAAATIGGVAQRGGITRGGRPGVDSILAALAPGEVILPADLREDFDAIAALGRSFRSTEPGSGPTGRGDITMLNRIEPAPDREREAIELIEKINDLVERSGYRLTASEVLA